MSTFRRFRLEHCISLGQVSRRRRKNFFQGFNPYKLHGHDNLLDNNESRRLLSSIQQDLTIDLLRKSFNSSVDIDRLAPSGAVTLSTHSLAKMFLLEMALLDLSCATKRHPTWVTRRCCIAPCYIIRSVSLVLSTWGREILRTSNCLIMWIENSVRQTKVDAFAH